jgi:hypothetical protein
VSSDDSEQRTVKLDGSTAKKEVAEAESQSDTQQRQRSQLRKK